MSTMNTKKMPQSEEEWKKNLTDEQYHIMRQKGTEAPFTGKYLNEKKKGVYTCAACGNELFSSDTKFDSGTGWPSFDSVISNKNIKTERDAALGMERVEVMCAHCGAHLGHVFDDGPTTTGKRYCINSVCLNLEEEK
jgi:peptide-methionine (R)-S-oxide reductase